MAASSVPARGRHVRLASLVLSPCPSRTLCQLSSRLPAPTHFPGALLSSATPVLLLPDSQAAAAAELAQLPPGPASATVLRLTAAVLRFLEAREAAAGPAPAAAFARSYPPLAVARTAAAAHELVAFAGRARWPALAALLLPATAADGFVQPAPAARAPMPAALVTAASPSRAPLATPGDATPPLKPAGKLAHPSPPLPAELAFELGEGDSLRRVMHPAVLAAVTLVAVGAVMGVGLALVTGRLG